MKRHLLSLHRSGQLRFRAETFGLYFPSKPEARPWWKVAPSTFLLLLRQTPRYRCWLRSMKDIQLAGPHEWWARQWPAIDMNGEYLRSSQEWKAEPQEV